MLKLASIATATAAAVALTAPAQASVTIDITQDPAPCSITDPICTFDFDAVVQDEGAFEATGTFTLPQFGAASGSITTTASFLNGMLNGNIDFSEIFLIDPNMTVIDFALATIPVGTSELELGAVSFDAIAGEYTLVARGTNSNGPSGFGGDLTFAAVPEPGTWLMMILGFGAIGFAMRGRKENVRRISVNYA
ncbi:FxDxF family PEP-CTERM protein [Qipengyuania sp. DGS5-3]|uniref:FxDxF family PEP-CTERM protein n=1 Tax=Qipengyuania sp. DGS5-3 TaxID=3349632 RepID=UPI0036D27ADC